MTKKIGKKLKIAISVTAALAVIVSIAVAWVFISMNNAAIDVAATDLASSSTRFIAHRGYSSKYYQNSELSFRKAAEESAFYGIECDIWRTADGKWVIAHDDNPFEDKSVRISKSRYDDIKDLTLRESNAGEGVTEVKGFKICTFDKYLDICAEYGKLAVIEFKTDYGADNLREVVEAVSAKLPYGKFMFASFYRGNLTKLFNIDPKLNLMYFSILGLDGVNHIERGYNVGVLHSLSDVKSVVKAAKKRGKVTNFWTVNDVKTIKTLIAAGADFVTTDIVPEI